MKGTRLAIVIAVVVFAAGMYFVRGRHRGAIDLMALYDSTTRQPSPDAFELTDVTINGETKRSIFTSKASRIKWSVTVPDNAWLKVALGLKPEAWDKEGNGVLFMIGVSDRRTFDQLVKQKLNPFAVPNDRRWVPMYVDLSAYAGENVEIILNTYAGNPDEPLDQRNDLAVWGAPEIVIR